MAVRLDVEPIAPGGVPDAEEEPTTRRRRRRLGFGLIKLSRRSDDGRELFARKNTSPLMLVDDHFALRHLCRA